MGKSLRYRRERMARTEFCGVGRQVGSNLTGYSRWACSHAVKSAVMVAPGRPIQSLTGVYVRRVIRMSQYCHDGDKCRPDPYYFPY